MFETSPVEYFLSKKNVIVLTLEMREIQDFEINEKRDFSVEPP